MPGPIGDEGMAKAAPAPQRRPRSWVGPLVVGVCFGLGYGLSQRLFNLQVGELVHFGRNFDVQPFRGSSLESLRLRFGSDGESIRADLESLDQERLQAEEAAKAAADAKEASASPDAGLAPLEPVPGPVADQEPPSAPDLPAMPTAPSAPSLPAPPAASPGSRP
jgi:hypothetical protein